MRKSIKKLNAEGGGVLHLQKCVVKEHLRQQMNPGFIRTRQSLALAAVKKATQPIGCEGLHLQKRDDRNIYEVNESWIFHLTQKTHAVSMGFLFRGHVESRQAFLRGRGIKNELAQPACFLISLGETKEQSP